ncbi:DUF547 domain-containing protein [Blastomonas marina]|uniref:DUF547 domain-containing protein n=1 Tax=Blastomonas marina TaxID=1867408 RepID=UPI002AC8C179|nr:DUF547 domain-containing protein [Blastomonas marina]WPZ03933.1 DUF547 domain-containing protein [Blastomonas marina]
MTRLLASTAILALALGAPAGVSANAAPVDYAVQADGEFARFTPSATVEQTELDWGLWDRALNWFVLNMGPSLREMAPKVEPNLGSRFTWGHTSRYRLEGNKIAFDMLEDKQRASLTEYRLDLQRIGSEIGLARLPRNEQLAFWINLHNVAVIEQIALDYPVMSPDKVEPEGFDAPLDEAKFITVAGVAMSPKDIRTRIVYPNWKDPRVIYGFFRGDIGSPSIAKNPYTGDNVAVQLAENATEFVNALRGVDRSGDTMKVSRIYAEAQPFFFPDFDTDLRAHLGQYAEEDVTAILAATSRTEASIYETDIADLSKGEREPIYQITQQCERASTGEQNCSSPDPRVNGAAKRFVQERRNKVEKLIEQGRIGTVIIREIRDGEEQGAEVE